MNSSLEGKNTLPETTIFGSIGIAVFLICAGIVYSIPEVFPERSLYVFAGILIIVVSVFNAFKGIKCNWSRIAMAIALILYGANKVFNLGLDFLPLALIGLGVISLLLNLKELKKDKK